MSEGNKTTPLTPDWVQFYQNNVQPQHTIFSGATDRVSNAPAVTAAAVTSPSPPPSHGQLGPSSSGLSPEGRIAKPVRRRSRASRRTPTTVFNTDASNFRAMVQQFTGGGLTVLPPPSPFSLTSGTGLGIGLGQQQLGNLNIPPPRASYNMQFEQVQSQQPYTLTSSSHGDHHLQAFLGRVPLPLPPHSHGGSSSSPGNDQNRSETNYML